MIFISSMCISVIYEFATMNREFSFCDQRKIMVIKMLIFLSFCINLVPNPSPASLGERRNRKDSRILEITAFVTEPGTCQRASPTLGP